MVKILIEKCQSFTGFLNHFVDCFRGRSCKARKYISLIMEELKNCVDFSIMDQYLAEQEPAQFDAEELRKAYQNFQEKGLLHTWNNPFCFPIDIINCPDDQFIAITDHFPVVLNELMLQTSLQESHLFSLDSDCHFFRHLNHLPAVVHEHEFFEITYVWQGECMQQCGSDFWYLKAGDFFILPPKTPHRIIVENDSSILFSISIRKNAFYQSFFSILAMNNAISVFLRNCLFGEYFPRHLLIHSDNHLVLKRIIKHFAFTCFADHSTYGDYTADILKQVFSYLITRGEVDVSFMSDSIEPSYMHVLKYIQEHYQNITLSDLSKQFYLSEAYLSRMIKKLTGQNFSHILRTIRIEKRNNY